VRGRGATDEARADNIRVLTEGDPRLRLVEKSTQNVRCRTEILTRSLDRQPFVMLLVEDDVHRGHPTVVSLLHDVRSLDRFADRPGRCFAHVHDQ
jgi:hypothetical protein